jgi:hypothetical protein
MPDIFLYAGEPISTDIKLRDPTQGGGGGGNVYNLSLEDSVVLADAASATLDAVVAQSDALTLSDVATSRPASWPRWPTV